MAHNAHIIAYLRQGKTPFELANASGTYDRDVFNQAVTIERELNGPVKCTQHERVLGMRGWTCVGCGDTVAGLPAGERPYSTANDF